MAKFKKDDRVIAVNKTYHVKKGWEGTVLTASSPIFVQWDNGERFYINEDYIELITKTNNMNNVKIAVSFENDSEKLAYLRYCENIGYAWSTGASPLTFIPESNGMSFDKEEGIEHCRIGYYKEQGYEIVTFKAFAALKGIEYKLETVVPLNEEYNALILDGKVKVGCQEFEFERIEALYKAIQDAKN